MRLSRTNRSVPTAKLALRYLPKKIEGFIKPL
jgi:hypothetical protein